MHTAICAFDDRDTAERARDRLLQAGFARQDVHLQHRGPTSSDAMGEDPSTWAGVEHEVALGPRVLERIADFFGSLLGERHPHAGTYTRHVAGGRTVVVVDAHDEAEVQRAHALLHGMQASDLQTMHRPEQRPLREIVGDSAAHVESPERVQAFMHGRSTDWTEPRVSTTERERAFAADPDRAAPRAGQPGDAPRVSDGGTDRPGNRDGLGRTRKDE